MTAGRRGCGRLHQVADETDGPARGWLHA